MELSPICVLFQCIGKTHNRRSGPLPALHRSTQQKTVTVIIALVVPIAVLLSCLACFLLHWRRRLKNDGQENEKRGDESITELSLGGFDTAIAKRRNQQTTGTSSRKRPEELRDPGNLLGQHAQATIIHELYSDVPSPSTSTNTKIDLGRMIANKTNNSPSTLPRSPNIAMVATDPSRIQSWMTSTAEIKEEGGLSIISEENDTTDCSSTTSWITAQETSSHDARYSPTPSSPKRTNPCKRTLRRSTNIVKHYGVVPPERRSSLDSGYWYQSAVSSDIQNTVDAQSFVLRSSELLSSDSAFSQASDSGTSRPLSSNPW